MAEQHALFEANKAVVRRHLLVGVTEKQIEVYDEIMAADYKLDVGLTQDLLEGGREGYKRGLSYFQAAFPDMRIELLNLVAEGDLVVARYVERGTHTGAAYGSREPSGRAYQKHGFGMYHIVGGRMVAGWIQEDDAAFARALGWEAVALD